MAASKRPEEGSGQQCPQYGGDFIQGVRRDRERIRYTGVETETVKFSSSKRKSFPDTTSVDEAMRLHGHLKVYISPALRVLCDKPEKRGALQICGAILVDNRNTHRQNT